MPPAAPVTITRLPGIFTRESVPLPAATLSVGPGIGDAVVAETILDERDQATDPLDHEIVQVTPLMLHRLAQRPRLVELAAVDRLDRAVHRRARHLRQLVFAEPPF